MKFIPYGKLSKKKKREADRARRGGWGALSPVTRRPDDPRAYNRSREKRKGLSEDGEGFSFFFVQTVNFNRAGGQSA